LIALALAAACPFTAIYTTTILTETWATLLVTGFAVVATSGLKIKEGKRRTLLRLSAGILGGAATMFRPDCALFVGGAGVTLLIGGIVRSFAGHNSHRPRAGIASTLVACIALTTGFVLVL